MCHIFFLLFFAGGERGFSPAAPDDEVENGTFVSLLRLCWARKKTEATTLKKEDGFHFGLLSHRALEAASSRITNSPPGTNEGVCVCVATR